MKLQKTIDSTDLKVGQTKRMNCPICDGDKTFTITNAMGKIIWNCYKASCKVSGAKTGNVSAETIEKAMLGKNVIDYDDNTIQEEQSQMLHTTWEEATEISFDEAQQQLEVLS